MRRGAANGHPAVRGLSFTYPKSGTRAIDGIDFDIREGEIFGFLGPSGAGKSTTQRILIRLLQGYGGEITYRGRPLSSYGNEFYQDIGVSFEMPISFSKLTALENLSFFQRLYAQHADVEALMSRVGLWDDRDKKAGRVFERDENRLNFVRALLNNPKVLFLDEPTNGLDPVNAHIMKEMVREFRDAGGTVFLTSHIMGDVDELCDRVAFIVDGRIRELDTPRSLKIKYGKRTVKVEYREDGAVVPAEFTFDDIRTERFASLLREKEIETIHSGETTLEDIFIQVTGVRLHEE
jgi:fluoroquinolone transport system ATP-binding protein